MLGPGVRCDAISGCRRPRFSRSQCQVPHVYSVSRLGDTPKTFQPTATNSTMWGDSSPYPSKYWYWLEWRLRLMNETYLSYLSREVLE